MTPKSKAPGTKRLKLCYDIVLSSSALKFNLRRYTLEVRGAFFTLFSGELKILGRAVQVDPMKPSLKAPGTNRLKVKYDDPLSNFPFIFNLRCYTWGPMVGPHTSLPVPSYGRALTSK